MLGRSTALLASTAALALAPAAQAQLPVPDPAGGAVTGALGTVGGLLPAAPADPTGALAPVLDQIDGVLAGGQPQLDPGALDGLLGSLGTLNPIGDRTAPGAVAGPAGVVVGPGAATGVIDGAAPGVSVRVLTHLHSISKTRRMVVRLGASEPALVAIAGAVRPGKALKAKKKHSRKARSAASRSLVRIPKAMLAFRRAGGLRVRISMSKAAARRLARSRNARLSLTVYAVDAARNQIARSVKRQVKR
jgi:hypothetical protein